MSKHKDTNQRSAFAESAYAHAERRASSSRRRRNQDAAEDDNILCYEDDNSGQARSNVVHAEFQPLAGASIVIIGNTSRSENLTNARILKLMEERESLGCAVESMGGMWVAKLEEGNRVGLITHAVWIDSDEDKQAQEQGERRALSHLSSETLVKLNTCISMDIPVVSSTWLMRIGELSPGQHWSEVDVEEHVPRIVNIFNNVNRVKSNPSPHKRSSSRSATGSSRRDDALSLGASISETYQNLMEENPDAVDEEALKRAMELSMLDFAIVHHHPDQRLGRAMKPKEKQSPHEILQVQKDASTSEIKIAYRRRALETHPDKGGKPGEFEAVARAYRCLLNAANNIGFDGSFDKDDGDIILKSTAHWDSELKEHRNLVRELYQQHGQDIDENLQRQNFSLERLGLGFKDAGSRNYNEKDQEIRNSCFYLSLASSYLSGIGAFAVWDKPAEGIDEQDKALLQEADCALIRETALQLKRVIEAAVLSAHPEWAAQGMVGEEVQAFSDFLVYILESETIVSDWCVVVFDTCSGFVDVYKGQNYKDEGDDSASESYAASNTLTLRYVPGHYQPLVAASPDSTRPSLKQIISVLDESSVLYVVTDGAAE